MSLAQALACVLHGHTATTNVRRGHSRRFYEAAAYSLVQPLRRFLVIQIRGNPPLLVSLAFSFLPSRRRHELLPHTLAFFFYLFPLSLQSAIMTSPGPPPPPPQPAKVAFRDFDLEDVYQSIQHQVMNDAAKNFVVEFGPDDAHVAVDLGKAEFDALLRSKEDPKYPVRWM